MAHCDPRRATFVNQLTGSKLPALEQQLDQSGVQWTPGRPIKLPEIDRRAGFPR